MIFAFFAEIMRFKGPGGNVINLAGAVFAVAYLGMLSTFLIQLRVVYGIAALFSLVIVTKVTDIGAYSFGRIFGRNKMSPGISPGKTIEGLIGGLICGCAGSLFWFKVALPLAAQYTQLIGPDTSQTTLGGCIVFGLLVSLGGVIGDLGESLLKRDAKQKDSGIIPGFGGWLDIFDSLLTAAPIAYACWVFQLVAPGHH
jgi:phosphatidate cytidylyltransferase